MIGTIRCIGVSNPSAPLELRERIAITREALPEFLHRARKVWPECVVLRTCWRFEVYAVENPEHPTNTLDAFAALVGVGAEELKPYTQQQRGENAAVYLLRVAAGLESPILGEAQILSQVRNAFLTASEHQATGPILSAMFRAAIHAGKQVRREASLNATSYSYAKLAIEALPTFVLGANPSRITIIGGGALASEVVDGLRDRGVCSVTVVSRHVDRASSIAARVQGEGRSLNELGAILADADVVIACMSLSEPVVKTAMLKDRAQPITIIDLGVPRNVDSGAASQPNVILKTLDQLLSCPRITGMEAFIGAAEKIVEEERRLFVRWLKARQIAPRVAKLRAWAAELDRETARRIKHIIHASIRQWQEGVVL